MEQVDIKRKLLPECASDGHGKKAAEVLNSTINYHSRPVQAWGGLFPSTASQPNRLYAIHKTGKSNLLRRMKSTYAIANRFREVVFNGTWVANTNYKHQLTDLDWKTATAKVNSLNSIAILAQHIHYYINGVNNVFKGGSLAISDKFSFDFPPFQSQNDWEAFLTKFWKNAEEFATLVEQMPEEKLKEVFVDEKYGTFQRNIDGMIEHCYYHLGQIVLLKKTLVNSI